MKQFKRIEVDYRFNLKIISYANSKTWHAAQQWAKEQGGRIPTETEMQILSELQRMGKLDTKFGDWFWSSTEWLPNPQYFARSVNFYNGNRTYNYKSNQHQVICVRDV